MKILFWTILLTLSTSCFSNETSTWTERGDYKFISQHAVALKSAKDWVRKSKGGNPNSSKTWHYEYEIKNIGNGFRIFVVGYTLSIKGDKQYYPGGHFSLEMDGKGKIYKIYPGV